MLGFRVDWPVTIVITQEALKIYADIFGYLSQIRFSLYSLTQTWRSLKVRFFSSNFFNMVFFENKIKRKRPLLRPLDRRGACVFCVFIFKKKHTHTHTLTVQCSAFYELWERVVFSL